MEEEYETEFDRRQREELKSVVFDRTGLELISEENSIGKKYVGGLFRLLKVEGTDTNMRFHVFYPFSCSVRKCVEKSKDRGINPKYCSIDYALTKTWSNCLEEYAYAIKLFVDD